MIEGNHEAFHYGSDSWRGIPGCIYAQLSWRKSCLYHPLLNDSANSQVDRFDSNGILIKAQLLSKDNYEPSY